MVGSEDAPRAVSRHPRRGDARARLDLGHIDDNDAERLRFHARDFHIPEERFPRARLKAAVDGRLRANSADLGDAIVAA